MSELPRDLYLETIEQALRGVDGSDRGTVRLLTGFTDAELDNLGGFAGEEKRDG